MSVDLTQGPIGLVYKAITLGAGANQDIRPEINCSGFGVDNSRGTGDLILTSLKSDGSAGDSTNQQTVPAGQIEVIIPPSPTWHAGPRFPAGRLIVNISSSAGSSFVVVFVS